jgi:DNA polymerase-3 subunit alpha
VTVAPNDFVHLHLHTEFSLLDGLGRINDLAEQGSQLGFDAMAITDHGALYGAVAFTQAVSARGIKPIIGIETYIARRSMHDKEGKADSQPFHLVLLAESWEGYQNLCKLATAAHLEGYYYKPRLDHEIIAKYSKGLIAGSACLGGEVAKALEVDDWDLARKVAGMYKDIFGRERFLLELQDHGLPEQIALNPKLIKLGKEVGLDLIVTNDLHYVRREQHEAHDVLLCVGTGNNLDTPGRMRFESSEFYLKSAQEMADLFPDNLDAILRTRAVAEMVDLKLPFGQLRIPSFPVPEGETIETWLRKECNLGLARRYGTVTPELQTRLDYELDVICRMGYAGYFLIVADFTAFARQQRIAITVRGSAPGSIVTYTLGITPVDPIHYQLPFERFLNPDRVTMPDIDVDFEDGRREEVINYVSRKYGADHVAQIITFGTMLAKAAVRDVARVVGMTYGEGDRISKAIPATLGMTLNEAIETSPPLKEMYDNEPPVHRVVEFAKQLEGVARNASTHAAGVVISREPLTELMPLQRATNSDAVMTQYEMHAVEALGLLKFDFLGLSNLTILRVAVDLIKAHRGEEIDLDKIPLDDKKTFDLLTTGETTGVFQLESAGMRRYIRELQPTTVFDLAAMVALYRPGPMDNIPSYIARKHGREKVSYLHPLLEPYLNRTYGVFVYQEDIMSASTALAGFSGPEADMLGYAIRKKKSKLMGEMREKFVLQAAERGVSAKVIDAVFAAFQPFERYGFNKAHATCYGLIAYQTAYLKANYTVDYMTSVLTAFRDNEEKVAAAVAECRRLGIEVRTPDVHKSFVEFAVEDDAIRFGLLAVKNVGEGAIESIIATRQEGDFHSLTDFCGRVDLRLVNKRVMECLIKVGAMNRFGHPAQLLEALDDAMATGQAAQRDRTSGQTSLFDMGSAADTLERPLPQVPEALSRERLRWEKELLGLYLSEHPLGSIQEDLAKFVTAYSGDLKDDSMESQRVVLGGIVTGIRTVVTRNKDTMAVAAFEDLQGTVEVVVFPKMYATSGGTFSDGAILLVAGRVDHRGDEASLLADAVWVWEDAVVRGPTAIASEVAASDKPRRTWPGKNGNGGNGNGNGYSKPAPPAAPASRPVAPTAASVAASVAPPVPGAAAASGIERPAPPSATPGPAAPVMFVSPLRGGALPVAMPGGAPLGSATSSLRAAVWSEGDTSFPASEREEPPLPEEAQAAAVRASKAPTQPMEAPASGVLNVRFTRGADTERIVLALSELRAVLKNRPGSTRVVFHIPTDRGGTQPMEIRGGVAYDTELVSEVGRRLGEGLVRLEVSAVALGANEVES